MCDLMGQKCVCNLLILNDNFEVAGFEWLPCLEGIKKQKSRLHWRLFFCLFYDFVLTKTIRILKCAMDIHFTFNQTSSFSA